MFTDEFFPTPQAVIKTMLSKISRSAEHFLEPSAGKGDIAEFMRQSRRSASIDCIENAPELCAVLRDKDFPIVGHDFLSYDGVCYYDAILMNPPFFNGDEHLLKAWNFLYSGEIVCLLNAETILNPHTKSRKLLAEIIEAHGEVEYLGDCFTTAERKTGVNVALVYLKKEAEDDTFDLWESDKQECAVNDDIDTSNIPAVIDRMGNMQHFYDEANAHMFKAFQHIRKAQSYKRFYSRVDVLSKEPLDALVSQEKKTWLDKELYKQSIGKPSLGVYDETVRAAIEQRKDWLIEKDLGFIQSNGVFGLRGHCLKELDNLEIKNAGEQLARDFKVQFETNTVKENTQYRYLGHVNLETGYWAILGSQNNTLQMAKLVKKPEINKNTYVEFDAIEKNVFAMRQVERQKHQEKQQVRDIDRGDELER